MIGSISFFYLLGFIDLVHEDCRLLAEIMWKLRFFKTVFLRVLLHYLVSIGCLKTIYTQTGIFLALSKVFIWSLNFINLITVWGTKNLPREVKWYWKYLIYGQTQSQNMTLITIWSAKPYQIMHTFPIMPPKFSIFVLQDLIRANSRRKKLYFSYLES